MSEFNVIIFLTDFKLTVVCKYAAAGQPVRQSLIEVHNQK